MASRRFVVSCAIVAIVVAFVTSVARAELPPPPGGMGYMKATEGNEVVLNKMYPKKRRVELNLLEGGFIMNQSFIDSYLLHGSLLYFPNEVWGFGIDGAYVINQDRFERYCVENFYNDPDREVGAECQTQDGAYRSDLSGASRANLGPAYMPIRELNYLLTASAIYNLAYGKQLYFLSATQYFDLYFLMGGGLAFSDYYPMETVLKNGNKARGPFPETGTSGAPGVDGSQTDQYGEAGRPVPTSATTMTVDFGVGQKIHFAKMANFKLEVRDYLLLGTPGGFETYFAMIAGLGVRF